MAQHFESWDSREEAEKLLTRRFAFARSVRAPLEDEWRALERAVFSTNGADVFSPAQEYQLGSGGDGGAWDSPDRISVNYVLKNVRLLHSQLSMNPPMVAPRPLTNDNDDHRRADAADRIIKFGLRQYNMQDTTDLVSFNTIIYGTGIAYTIWNPDAGVPVEFDEESGKVIMSGDFEYECGSVWEFYPSPDARSAKKMPWYFRSRFIPYEEACHRWGKTAELKEALEVARHREEQSKGGNTLKDSELPQPKWDMVHVVEYWESGAAHNGFCGRLAYGLVLKDADIKLLEDVRENPHQFSRPLRKGESRDKKRPMVARLPVKIFTDIDVPNSVWGKSAVAYAVKLQDAMNRLDTTTLDVLKAHGIARLILDEKCRVSSDTITNSTWDIVYISKESPNVPDPKFMPPLELPTALPNYREQLRQAIQDMFGTNESMFGQMSRETANVTMQMATQQGNMIRRRLFNKYSEFVEDVYRDLLDIVRMHWDVEQTVSVLGNEKALETADFKGSDLDGGFDIVTEYGTNLSLDPLSRRQEILTLLPLFEKANVPPRTFLRYLKLNELEQIHDMSQLGADRQQDIFTKMIATGEYIEPEELQDHASMLEYAHIYLMTAEFDGLSPGHKDMIRRHVKAREVVAKTQATGGGAPAPAQLPPAEEPTQQPQNLGELLGGAVGL